MRYILKLPLSLVNVFFKSNCEIQKKHIQVFHFGPEGPICPIYYVNTYWKFPQLAACGTPDAAAEVIF